MKRIITLVAALAIISAPAATAQKISSDAHKAKLEKSNADIANPKKAAKSATWYNRGKICVDAIVAPTKDIFSGLDANMLQISLGTAPIEVKDNIHSFEWVDVHTKNGKVVAWAVKKQVLDNAYEIAKEAFLKAYELDPASAPKIKTALEVLVNHYSELGSVSLDITEYKTAIDVYMKAVGLQENPAIGKVDPRYYFFAGQLAAFLGAEDVKYYADGEKYLNKAKELGYMDANGNTYYFLFHCYYGQKDADAANVLKARDILLEGIDKFPKNEKILDGLMQLYTSEDSVGNPADLVAMIDKALAETPDNPDLWFGRGRVFFKLHNYDECINSFLKINELKPNDYDTNFYIGYFYIAKADEMNKALNAKADTFSSFEEYEVERKVVNAEYMKALPFFEKAYELNQESLDCAQMLKELCFRLRTEEGVLEKYNKYNAAYKKLKGIE